MNFGTFVGYVVLMLLWYVFRLVYRSFDMTLQESFKRMNENRRAKERENAEEFREKVYGDNKGERRVTGFQNEPTVVNKEGA